MPRRVSLLFQPRLVLSVPPLAGIAMLAAFVTVEAVHPGALTAPRAETIPEAVVMENLPGALEMMADGLNVNAPAVIRSGVYDQHEYEVTPLEAALLSRRIEAVRLLMQAGADVSRSRRVRCLVREHMPEAAPELGISAPAEPPVGELSVCFAPAGP